MKEDKAYYIVVDKKGSLLHSIPSFSRHFYVLLTPHTLQQPRPLYLILHHNPNISHHQ
jgi:hypothetical protein